MERKVLVITAFLLTINLFCLPFTEARKKQTYQLTEERLQEIRNELMYPYFDNQDGTNSDYQESISDSTPEVQQDLKFNLPFYGFRYNYTRLSINGYLEFSDPPPILEYPLVFPTKGWPEEHDPAFIGIFYSKCRLGTLRDDDEDTRTPGVYYRVERDLPSRTDQFGVELRERLKVDIRDGIIGTNIFNPKHAIIVTWKNMSFAGGITSARHTTNTFQLVLATDEVFTYAIFNYQNLVWTSHTEAGGDTLTGLGGIPAFVGFNGGNGTQSFNYLPYSQTSIIRDLTETGFANNIPGRHIFRIDEKIEVGSCNSDIDGANLPLNIAPKSGNMLGGSMVNVTGPCFKPDDEIYCTFGYSEPTPGVIVDLNRAYCIQPPLYGEGFVKLEITIGSSSKWKGQYYVEAPKEKIIFSDLSYQEVNPSSLRIAWDPHNLTDNMSQNIRLSLWTESNNGLKCIRTLDDSIPNTGSYNIIPSVFVNDNTLDDDYRFGFLQLNFTDSFNQTHAIWSNAIPLGWYFRPQWIQKYGINWTDSLCENWIEKDRLLTEFIPDMPPCPCNLKEALEDKIKFMADPECDQFTNPKCYFNEMAMHCVVSPTPISDGHQQQCCYDVYENLMLFSKSDYASSPRRCHSSGQFPYENSLQLPTLSQWYNDFSPKYFCCLWGNQTSDGCNTLKFERRPSQTCNGYLPIDTATVNGEVNITNFDYGKYEMNSTGDIVLTKLFGSNDSFVVQGRFHISPFTKENNSRLEAVAVRGNSSVVVNVKIRPPAANWRYKLDVFVDSQRIYFDRPNLKTQRFQDVTIYTPSTVLNQSQVIVSFSNGAGVEIIEELGQISAKVYLPTTFINQTRGLFGNYNYVATDDFALPDGTLMEVDPTDPTQVNDFVNQWLVTDVDDPNKGRSLFFYNI